MSWGKQVREIIQPQIERELEGFAEIAREEVVRTMSEGSPGGYQDPETGERASAPGEAPAFGKGVYAGSWKVEAAFTEAGVVQSSAFSDLLSFDGTENVGRRLEWGDEIEPRPHARPARENAIPLIEQRIRRINGR